MYNILRFSAVLLCFFLVHQALASAPVASACHALELSQSNQTYNKLVCAGVSAMNKNDYKGAATYFEQATNLKLFEFPNFELFPRLALAYFKAGERTKAEANLQKARLSLNVLVGIVKCRENESGFYLVGSDNVPISSRYSLEIAKRMCGAAYSDLYKVASLEDFLGKAKLLKYYFSISRQIESTTNTSHGHQ